MTDKQILQKAIEKAQSNSFKTEWYYEKESNCFFDDTGICLDVEDTYKFIIFSHYFAKAFWKKEMAHYKLTCNVCGNSFNFIDEFYNPKYCSDCGNKLKKIIEYKTDAWQYHLQQMVLEKEPLKYIEKFL